jgi:outer membrane protein OmpA-like peptidoglycan-associated protein
MKQVISIRMALRWVALILVFMACKVVEKAKTGADAFNRKQYFISAALYEKEFEANSNQSSKAKLAYGAAVSHQKINETAQAMQWFKEAANLDFGDVAWKEYGLAQIQLGDYEGAIRTFETVLNKKGNSEEFKLLVSTARQGLMMAQEKLNIYNVVPLALNTAASEYAPSIDPKGNLVFTSDRPSVTGEDVYKWTGRKFSDLFSGQADGPETISFSADLNTVANEGTSCFNHSGNVILFTRCGFTTTTTDAYCKLFISTINGGKWAEPQALPFQKEEVNYMHPCFAANDSVIFFVSDDARGEGGTDIYYSEWNDDQWQTPERLGRRINSASNEKFPFMFHDTLYFASDKLGGLGGLDIYKSFVNDKGEWQPPINLKSPINSNEDDFGLVVDEAASTQTLKGYFTSSRLGGAGKDDLYRFERMQTDESVLFANKESKDTVTKSKEIKYLLYLSIIVVQAVHQNPEDPNSPVIEKKPLPNSLVLLREGNTPIQVPTNERGNALREIKFDQDYFVLATFPGLLNASKTLTTREIKDPAQPVKTLQVEIMLDKVYSGKEVLIPDIYYDLDQWLIRKDAEPPLNQLVQLLKDNPRIKIQLSSHTDCRATDAYNLELSQKRAQSAVEYLIKNGIAQTRLTPKGFGESQLVNICPCEQCTEEEHQANRRTTFLILE